MDPNYISYAMGRESGGNPYAANTRSSAKGLFQFTDPTWLDTMRRHPELGLQPGGQFDPAQSSRAMKALTDDNAGILTRAGYATTNDNMYAAHRFGAGGALKVLGQDPSTPAETAFSPQVLAANPDLRGKTVGQVLSGSPRASSGSSALDAIDAYAPQAGPPARQSPPADDSSGGQSFMDKLNTGGPGALIGMPGGVTPGGYDAGTALMGAGAALASIGSPQQGAALAELSKPYTAGKFSMHVDPLTGAVYRIDNQKGTLTIMNGGVDPTTMMEKKAQAEADGKRLSADDEAVVKNAGSARTTLSNLAALKSALSDPNVYQGTGGDAVNKAKALAKSLGFQVDGVEDAQFAQSLSRQMALQLRNPTSGAGMPGSLSDQDRNFLASMAPGLGNTPGANAAIIDWQSRLAQHAVDINDQRQQYVQQHGRLDKGWYDHLNAWEKANPVFGDQDRMVLKGLQDSNTPTGVSKAARPALGDIFGR